MIRIVATDIQIAGFIIRFATVCVFIKPNTFHFYNLEE